MWADVKGEWLAEVQPSANRDLDGNNCSHFTHPLRSYASDDTTSDKTADRSYRYTRLEQHVHSGRSSACTQDSYQTLHSLHAERTPPHYCKVEDRASAA